MGLTFDGSPQVRSVTCPSCGREYPYVTAFVTKDGVPSAIVYVACDAHDDHNEAWIDVTVGSFDEPDFAVKRASRAASAPKEPPSFQAR